MKVYLAGSLFDVRHLAGNALLGRALERASSDRISVYLPQDYEPESLDPKSIRDGDFEGLLGCDAAVFQFDGAELDSGTVAEFMAAKFVDIPAVLLRTDFRKGGDRNREPWNLMCSFYPRTISLVVDGIGLYAGYDRKRFASFEAAEKAIESLAAQVIEKLEAVCRMPPVSLREGEDRIAQLRKLLGISGA